MLSGIGKARSIVRPYQQAIQHHYQHRKECTFLNSVHLNEWIALLYTLERLSELLINDQISKSKLLERIEAEVFEPGMRCHEYVQKEARRRVRTRKTTTEAWCIKTSLDLAEQFKYYTTTEYDYIQALR